MIINKSKKQIIKSKYVVVLIFTIILVSFAFFTYKTAKGQELLPNPLEVKPKSVAGGIFSWVSALFYSLSPFFIIFLVEYFAFLTALKILHIEGIPKSKIITYIFIAAFSTWFINFVASRVLGAILNNGLFYYSFHFLIYFLVVFLFIKYYFRLFGKKLWQLTFCFIVLNILFILILSLIVSALFPLIYKTV